MNAQPDPGQFQSAARIEYSTAQIRQIAIEALHRRGRERMRTLDEIERADPAELESRSIIGTVLAPIATALRARGVMVSYTYGAIAQQLAYDPRTMHVIFCGCGNGPFIPCEWAGDMLEAAIELETNGNLLSRAFQQGRA